VFEKTFHLYFSVQQGFSNHYSKEKAILLAGENYLKALLSFLSSGMS
jgi:hypothetical protein